MKDPVDHARTTRPHAGESLKDGSNAPGLLAVAVAVVVLVISLYFFATGQPGNAGVAVAIAAILGAVGSTWLAVRHRRVRRRAGAPQTPPTS